MHRQRVESLSHGQRERLAYIDFRLYFFGEIGRPDLSGRFGVAPAGATRDLALYREIAPQNIEFDGSNKIYRIGKDFAPLFEHASQRVLSALASAFGLAYARAESSGALEQALSSALERKGATLIIATVPPHGAVAREASLAARVAAALSAHGGPS